MQPARVSIIKGLGNSGRVGRCSIDCSSMMDKYLHCQAVINMAAENGGDEQEMGGSCCTPHWLWNPVCFPRDSSFPSVLGSIYHGH